jgi:hypothetical protein
MTRASVARITLAGTRDALAHPTGRQHEPAVTRAPVTHVARARRWDARPGSMGRVRESWRTRGRIEHDSRARRADSRSGHAVPELESHGWVHESNGPVPESLGQVHESYRSRTPAGPTRAQVRAHPPPRPAPPSFETTRSRPAVPSVSPTSPDRNDARRTISGSRTGKPESSPDCLCEGSETKARPARSMVLRVGSP